jgi:hypothetical protein
MAGLSQKEYNEQVDEALIMFGGGAPCCNIDPRLWGDFKELYKEFIKFFDDAEGKIERLEEEIDKEIISGNE